MPVNLSPSNQTSDHASPGDLVAACLAGDSAAWQALVDRYVRLVRSTALRHGIRGDDVDDITQDVFVALARSLHEIEDPERLPGWLAITTRRGCWRLIQRNRREQQGRLADLIEEADAGVALPSALTYPSMTTLLDGWHRQELLATSLSKLNERCRRLIHLLFLDPAEPSYDEIARELEIAVGSIGPTRHRCLAKLRGLLEGGKNDE